MDLSTIQMHLDNFATTWDNWAKLFKGVVSAFTNVDNAVNFLSSKGDFADKGADTAAGWFPKTVEAAKK
ncbi:hypothetical protein G7Y31_01885 [Corynebacterium lizhenjunii]|uniref:Uncharacterized protein n=1 Tax=Corynebacterium lizhenjunii TaxID=2709394 RepID=A0A7T0PAV2_9CORY|nr:hypothetical protein [Corynebacterium lizhenjunii]QPK79486.1 hypothetical protein G7Y31_01885 [Corynebacterium lizhenjunii]